MSDNLKYFINSLAEYYEAKVKKTEGTFKISSKLENWMNFTNNKEDIIIYANPISEESWHTRLQFVENTIAKAIYSAPKGYSCQLNLLTDKGNHGKQYIEMIRLTYCFRLSVGKPIYKRYISYYFPRFKNSFFINGDDHLFDNIGIESFKYYRASNKKYSFDNLLKSVIDAYEDYIICSEVKSELEILDKSLVKEVSELDRLYTSNHGQYAKLIGLKSEKHNSEDSIEIEYFNKLQEKHNRYTQSVLFLPLSLGIINLEINESEMIDKTNIKKCLASL